MFRRIIALVVFASLLWSSPLPAVQSLVRVTGLSRANILEMAKEGFDLPKVGKDFVEVVLTQPELKDLVKSGLKHSILVPDLDKYVSDILAVQKAGGPQYFTYQTMTETLKKYASQYAKICKLESIGKSFEKRDIWALKISDNPEKNEKEPAACIMGAHHSREWISFEVPMATLKTILEGYGKDEKLTRLVNEREIWFVPMVNPDGVTYSQTKEKFWRKNRRKNSDGSFGVDPNRNYGYQWSDIGASDSPGSDVYHGTGPFSEPETQTIRDFAKREKFSADISFHSYSELILWPWSYTGDENCPDRDLFAKFGAEMAEFNKYTSQVSADLYPSSGDTDDFMYGELKSLSFTFELATTFIPQPSEIAKICDSNVPAVLHLIDKAGTYGLVTPAGDEKIAGLDNRTAIDALKDLAQFGGKDAVAHRLQQVRVELAHRVLNERKAGTHDLEETLQAESANAEVASVLNLVKKCQSFETLHTKP